MKSLYHSLMFGLCFVLLIGLNGCGNKQQAAEADKKPDTEQTARATAAKAEKPNQLPARYQRPGFLVTSPDDETALDRDEEQFALKVGANITSTKGPQPLWDIVKRLANLKGMSVSWASDVDQTLLVDVNIKADDNFFDALDNLLRQVDYFHEVQGNTIIIKYRETRRFYISLPNMKGSYTTTVGGNFLTDREAANGTEGTVKITSDDNQFDIWKNIQENMDIIMKEWTTTAETKAETETKAEDDTTTGEGKEKSTVKVTRMRSNSGSYYTIDRSVGMITVTAPRPILEKVDEYLKNLKRELYRQVVIEAKIIEVYLQDNSKIGLDWSQVLKNFSINGLVQFGTGDSIAGSLGQVYPQENFDRAGLTPPIGGQGDDRIPFLSKVSLASTPFTVVLNALNEQGDAKVLSNPKLTVLNGQPALLSVGKDIAYIKTVSKNIDSGTGTISTVTYTAEVDNVVEGVSLGVMASIIDDDSVVLHLTPITTDLINDTIEYREFGDGLEVGLPRVGIREMSTTVQVDNGEMLIIGGLIDSIEGKTEDFAPILGDIPIIRYLFGVEEKRKEKRELVILLTPRVI